MHVVYINFGVSPKTAKPPNLIPHQIFRLYDITLWYPEYFLTTSYKLNQTFPYLFGITRLTNPLFL